MARALRVEFPGAEYHVTARGNERRKIYRDDLDRACFLDCLEEMTKQFSVQIRAFCLMPNHYHLVVGTPRANLSRAVGWLQTTYTIRFNRRHRRCGHLFQGRFKAHLVEADGYAISLLRYIHLNPVRVRGLNSASVEKKERILDAYRWSSHCSYSGMGSSLPWLTLDWQRYHGSARAAAIRSYRRDLHEALAAASDLPRPWDSLRGGLVLGGNKLWDRAKSLLAKKEGQQEIRWNRFHVHADQKPLWEERIKAEPDKRWKIWLRVKALGERKVDIARELGYRDGGTILQIVKRLEQKAKTDKPTAIKKHAYETQLSSVES